MAYKPAFDISTLHYANKAVAWLASDDEQVPILRLLRYVKQFAIWNHESEGQSYLHLNRIIARASGLTEESSGQFRHSGKTGCHNRY